MLGTEHEGHHSLMAPARATLLHPLLGTQSNSKQCFLECRGPASRQRQRPRAAREKSDSPLLFSHSEDSAAMRLCSGRSFLEALRREERSRQRAASTFPGRSFPKVTVSIHQFTLISTLHSCSCTRGFAWKPCHKSTTG